MENKKYISKIVKSGQIPPSAYSPILAIGGIAVPIYLSGTTTVDDVTYNIYKSNNTYRSTFSVNLL